MHKYIIAIALLFACLCSSLHAAPVQYALDIPASAVAAPTEFTVPYYQDGTLLSWQALGAGSAETLAVKHITTYAAGKALTNSVETAAARNVLIVYPERYQPPQSVCTNTTTGTVITTTPVKPVYLMAGDRISFQLSATNATTTVIIKTSLRE
jgi:hypothetical protein